ncbi:MAG: hypothetical protein D6694_02615 [Gammaproteobacteria bacterium]|nr:MAG: hypothetical protein D6694_02615 [Gammaproteobacteria bacterium]
MEDIIVPVVFFLSIVAIFLGWFFFRHRSRKLALDTLTLLTEKGQTLTPELIEQVVSGQPVIKDIAVRDLRRGILLVVSGIGLGLASYFVTFPFLKPAGLVVIFVGLGYGLSGYWMRKTEQV